MPDDLQHFWRSPLVSSFCTRHANLNKNKYFFAWYAFAFTSFHLYFDKTYRTWLQNMQDKSAKASTKKQPILEHSLKLEDKSLRSCSRNQAKMLSNVILESYVTSNITRSSDSFSTVQPIVNGDRIIRKKSFSGRVDDL